MKKIFCTILAIAALATAQVQASVFNWGVTGGMNITEADVDNAANTFHGWTPDSETGWYAGLQFRIVVPIVGVGVDFGAVFTQETLTLPDNNKEDIGYLSVPVHLRYELKLPLINDALTPYVFTGPQASYNIQQIDDKVAETFKTEDLVWHWDLGAGVILFDHLQVSYHYGFPLTNTGEYLAPTIGTTSNQIESDWKLGTHHLGLTLYF